MAYATRGRLNDAAQALMMMLASPPAEEQAFELPAEEQAFELPAEKQAFELPAEEQALELPAVLTWGRKRKRSQQPDVGQDFGGGEDMVGAAVHGAPTCSRFVQQQPVSATYGSHRAISTSFAYDSVRVADAGTGGGGSGAAAASAVDRVEEAIMFQPSYGRASSKAAGPAPPPMEPACTTTVKETAYGLTSGLNGAVL
ncbi:hypothetical protein OEZ86_006297 [Tetradesmus obliquus]|nr:hypothetical protein OEZ86_006297 [Tetradesmus obliquus]